MKVQLLGILYHHYLNEYNMEKNKLLEVINREDLKIGEDGYVKFRSGMDACADPLVLDGTHISDLIRDWFEHNKKVREENGWV